MDKIVSWRISEAEIFMNFWPTLECQQFGAIPPFLGWRGKTFSDLSADLVTKPKDP